MPEHPAIVSAVHADPSLLAREELEVRTTLRLAPLSALARVSGEAATRTDPRSVSRLPRRSGCPVPTTANGGSWLPTTKRSATFLPQCRDRVDVSASRSTL